MTQLPLDPKSKPKAPRTNVVVWYETLRQETPSVLKEARLVIAADRVSPAIVERASDRISDLIVRIEGDAP